MPSTSKLLIILLLSGVYIKLFQTSEDENRLVHYLFSEQGYNPLVRPTQHSNETVVVSFGLLLVQLIHVELLLFSFIVIIFLCYSFLHRFMKKNKL